MAVSTVDELLAVLEKSKLLNSEQLAEARRFAQESRDPTTLVRILVREKLVSRWQAAQLLAGRASFYLGKYKLIQLLGRGGMGSVFLAEHVTMNRRVALKIVPRHVGNDQASLERFFAEARAIAALDHPNIVQAYSVDNEFDRYFIVMEFVDGQDLQQIVESDGPLAVERAADYIRQAAEGLAHAHTRKMVHCDIKPSNLLVNNQGVVKILDLGLARLKGSDETLAAKKEEVALGTVDYLSPEQALETPDFDHRADIYSLGCTLYFLLTGHPPFPEGTLAQRIMKHQTQEPRDLLEERPEIPPPLAEICRKMMAKKADDRYQSADDVSEALMPWKPSSRRSDSSGVLKIAEPLEDEFAIEGETAAKAAAAAPAAAGASVPKEKADPEEKAEAAPEKKAGARMAAAIAAKLNTRGRKIGAGVAAGALLLLAIGLPFVFSGSKPPDPEVTQSPEQKTDDDAQKQADKDKAEKSESADEEDSPKTKKVKKKHADDEESEESEKPKKGKKGAKKTDSEDEETASDDEKPKKSKKKPAAEDGEKEPKAKTETKAAAKTDAKPAVKTEAKPAAKPETKPAAKPEVKPKETPKKVSLDTLAAAVDIPATGRDAETPVSLGRLDLAPKAPLEIQLLGGDIIAKGNPKFDVQAAPDGQEPGWFAQMTMKGKDPVNVAHIWRDQGELKFQWLADAKESSSPLRFCGLLVSCEGKQKFVALSKPVAVAAFGVDLTQNMAKVQVMKDGMPEASLLRLQLAPLDKIFPKYDVRVQETKKAEAAKKPDGKSHGKTREPKGPKGKPVLEFVSGDTVAVKNLMEITFTKEKEKLPPCGFHIQFDVKGEKLTVEMRPVCDFNGQLFPFSVGGMRTVAGLLQMADPARHPAAKGGKGKKPAAPMGQAETLKMFKENLDALKTLFAELHLKGKVNFRVFIPVTKPEDPTPYGVTIFQSGLAEEGKAEGGPKGAQGGFDFGTPSGKSEKKGDQGGKPGELKL